MEYYLKINGTHSFTTDKLVVPIDAQGVQFMKFPTASRAGLQIDWIKKTGFQVSEYAIIPADQPLQIQPPTQEEATVAEDINQLWATGNAYQVNMLLIKIMEQFRGNELAVSVLSHHMNQQPTSTLELSFLTAGGFPKDKLHWITSSMLDTAGLKIRVKYDEKGANYNEQFIFADSKWSFETLKNFTGIDLTKRDINKDPDIWYCAECGSTDVEIKTWTLPNDGDKPSSGDLDRNDCWCNHCEAHTSLEITTQSKYADVLKHIQEQGNQEEKEEEQDNELPPKERIRRMILNYGVTKLDLEEYCPTGNGYIATVYTEMIEYAHGDAEYYENIDDEVLENLVIAVEQQILANEKAFRRCQD